MDVNHFWNFNESVGYPRWDKNHEAFSQAEIEQVIVHKQSNIWEFRFAFENILLFELF